jgi:hypothetical protein
METDASGTEATSNEDAVPDKTGRPPPIILTSTTNLNQLQKQLKSVFKENFQFHSTKNGTRVITRVIVDFQSVKSHFDANNLSCSFYPKSDKSMKAVIRHLPHNTPADDISDGLVNLGFDVMSVKQMTATRRSSSDGSAIINLPLFLITLPRTAKSQELFRPQSLCHIAMRMEACRAQNGLTQCRNCQQFDHVWTNIQATSPLLVVLRWSVTCTRSAARKEVYFPPQYAATVGRREEKNPHPANYRGCRHAWEEMQKKKLHRTPRTTT